MVGEGDRGPQEEGDMRLLATPRIDVRRLREFLLFEILR